MGHHPDKDFVTYILKGIESGFSIGTISTAAVLSATKNMHSATLNPSVTDDYIKQEVELGNMIGPFPQTMAPEIHINHIGVIPKKHQPG